MTKDKKNYVGKPVEVVEEGAKGIDNLMDTLGWVVDNIYIRLVFMIATFVYLCEKSNRNIFVIFVGIIFFIGWIYRVTKRTDMYKDIHVQHDELLKGEITQK